MKRIVIFLFVFIMIFSMAVSSFAITPKWEYKPIKLPEIKVSIKIPNNVFDDWFKNHPLDLNISYVGKTLG